MTPLSNVSAFSYRDGRTFLEVLYDLRDHINDVMVPNTNINFDLLWNDFQAGIANSEASITNFTTEINAAFDEFKTGTDADVSAAVAGWQASFNTFTTSLNADFNTFKTDTTADVDTAVADIAATKADWISQFDTFIADITAQLGTLNDAGMATNIASSTTATYSALRAFVKRPPAYIGSGARTKSWDLSRHLYNGESATMRTIRDVIRRGLAGERKRIVAAGDSKTFGNGSTQPQVSTNSYPAQLQELLGANPGLIYGNLGDLRWSAASNIVSATGTNQNFLQSPGGAWSATFTSIAKFTGFKVFAYISAGGTVDVTVDGVAQTPFTVTAGSTWKVATYSGLSDAVHTIVFSGTGITFLLGLEPTYATGLTISNAGRPSSSAAEWLSPTDWSRLYSAAFSVNNTTLTPLKPDAAFINIGTNTNSSTLDDITSFITNVNGLAIPVLLIVFGGVGSAGNYDNKRVRLYDIADSLDLPLIDFTSLIGDQPAATAAGLLQDTVHENSRGYALEADALARVIRY
jgi:hypothetical protein